MRHCIFGLVFIVAVVNGVGGAHDIAVFPAAGDRGLTLVVRYGHPGDYQDTLAGKLVALEPGLDGVWVFSAFYDNGFFLRTADGRSVSKERFRVGVALLYPSIDRLSPRCFDVLTFT